MVIHQTLSLSALSLSSLHFSTNVATSAELASLKQVLEAACLEAQLAK